MKWIVDKKEVTQEVWKLVANHRISKNKNKGRR